MIKKLLLVFLLALPCVAQVTGNITASGSTCATTNACVSQQLSASAASAGVTISGTWSATLQFEASNDNGATWASVNATPINSTSAVTSATGNGTWRINVSGMTNVRVRGSAYASGTAQVTITFGSGSASTSGGGAGTPGGSNTQIQYNNAGAFGGDSECTTNGTGTLTCTSFLGALTGNVTGNVSGSSGSATGNAGTATTLATPRAIYGNNFNGSAALTQIIASTFGGTGNGFTKFSGPTTSEKTFTLPDASATIGYTVASGSVALATGAIASGACTTAQDGGTATGVLTTDTVVYTPAADPTGVTGYAVSASGSLYIWAYPTADHVNFKVCNNTSGSLTPSALTLNWRVAR